MNVKKRKKEKMNYNLRNLFDDDETRREGILRRQQQQQQDVYYRIRNLFREEPETYKIERINLNNYPAFGTSISAWRITGAVDMFNVNRAINDLVNEALQGSNPNSRV